MTTNTARARKHSVPLRLSDDTAEHLGAPDHAPYGGTEPATVSITAAGKLAVHLDCVLGQRAEELAAGKPVTVYIGFRSGFGDGPGMRGSRPDPIPMRLDTAEEALGEALDCVREAKRLGLHRLIREEVSA